MHGIRSQMHPFWNHPDPAVHQILLRACLLLWHVPGRWHDTGRYVCGLPDEVFHIYRNYRSPGRQLHNQRHMHADTHTHQSSPDRFQVRSLWNIFLRSCRHFRCIPLWICFCFLRSGSGSPASLSQRSPAFLFQFRFHLTGHVWSYYDSWIHSKCNNFHSNSQYRSVWTYRRCFQNVFLSQSAPPERSLRWKTVLPVIKVPQNLPVFWNCVRWPVLHQPLCICHNHTHAWHLRPDPGSQTRYLPCPAYISYDRSCFSSDLPESLRLRYFHWYADFP